MAAYSASKFAVEGYSEALYHELLPLGIKVSLVQPGMVKTGLFKHAIETENKIEDYRPWYQALQKEVSIHAEKGIESDVVADKVFTIIQAKNAALINRVGPDAKLVARLKRFLPKAMFHHIWRREFGLAINPR